MSDERDPDAPPPMTDAGCVEIVRASLGDEVADLTALILATTYGDPPSKDRP